MDADTATVNERYHLGPGPDRLGALIDIIIYFAGAGATFGVEAMLRSAGWMPYPDLTAGAPSLLVGFFLVVWLMKRRGQRWPALGLRRPKRWWSLPAWAFVVLVVTILLQLTAVPLLAWVFDLPAPDMSRYDVIVGNFPVFLTAAIGSMVTGGFIEEVIYRGLMVDRLARLFGGTKRAVVLAALLCGVPFGLIHFKWGIGGMVSTAVMGATLGLMYLATRRNLWPLIAAHATLDFLLMWQVYTGMLSGA